MFTFVVDGINCFLYDFAIIGFKNASRGLLFCTQKLAGFPVTQTVSHFLEIFILSQDFWGNHVREINFISL